MAHRRAFLKSAALAQATLVLPGAATAAASAADPPPPASAQDGVAQALTQAVRARFGDQLDLASLEDVRRAIADNLAAAARLRTLQLSNADEPAALFAARGEVRPR